MRIKDLEEKTGLTKRNINYYDNEGMLPRARATNRRYWHFSDEDLRRLKEIKLLRKLGIIPADIKSIFRKQWTLRDCLDSYITFLGRGGGEDDGDGREDGNVGSSKPGFGSGYESGADAAFALMKKIRDNETDIGALDVDCYLGEISRAEEGGTMFADIVKDFKAHRVMPGRARKYFEPSDVIADSFEFAKELEQYAQEKGLSLTIVRLGMNPIIILGGTKYICRLEYPRALFRVPVYIMGYRIVYLYECEDSKSLRGEQRKQKTS